MVSSGFSVGKDSCWGVSGAIDDCCSIGGDDSGIEACGVDSGAAVG